jgi:dihydroorotase
MEKITIQSPYDMHLHLRDENMLKLVGPLSSQTFAGAIIMPNLVPPVDTKEVVVAYKRRFLNKQKVFSLMQDSILEFLQLIQKN